MELNRDLRMEKGRLERRLAQNGEELDKRTRPADQGSIMDRMRELLQLETVPRELVVALVEKIEIGERDPATGRQEIRITWKF